MWSLKGLSTFNAPSTDTHGGDLEKDSSPHSPTDEKVALDDASEDVVSKDAQTGIQQAEAINLVWTKKSLIATYVFLFASGFILTLEHQVTYSMTPYVTSSFNLHSLLSVIGIVSNILSGIFSLPTAKILDIWGRAEGFAFMTFLTTVGLVLMAVCQNVETYAAAQVFHGIGSTGCSYVASVVMADTSSLKNRGLVYGVMSSYYIATTFAGPALAQRYLLTSSYRWGFGTFAIVVPIVQLPITLILLANQRKAQRLGLLIKTPSGRTFWQSIKHYVIEFDAAGVILLSGGLVCFLLSFTLAGYQADTWRSASIIAMMVVGVILIIGFGLYERYVAPTPFIPFHLLASRTVVGACGLSATLFVSFYCWDGYYTSYLQVVHDLSISKAGMIGNIYTLGSCTISIFAGLGIRQSGKYKWLAWAAIPISTLGGGLMIHFRKPDTDLGFVIMCQIFIAVGGGTLVICEQMAVMAVSEHGQIAAILALLGLASSVGGGIGSSVSGAIWTNTLPSQLAILLPEESKGEAASIYESLVTQLSYPVGTPIRDAIIGAYGVTQQRMCIAGTSVMVFAWISIAMWKDVQVKNMKQVKGLVV